MNFNDDNASIIRKPKLSKVRNKLPASVQITSEQLLREAKERELESTAKPPQQLITTEEEKKDYQLQKRQDYENNLRKDRLKIINWMKYATFEISQGEIVRARNIFERALNTHSRNASVWLKYAEMEIEHKQINSARNLFERALAIIPRYKQLWYKYAYMEEKLQNIEAARRVFSRWMRWIPEEQAWHSFINFEVKYGELDNAREIYQNFVQCHPDEKNWIKWAKFEARRDIHEARRVYETSIKFFGHENPQPKLLLDFAQFEERQHEHERVEAIYKYARENLPDSMLEEIYKAYHNYEKKYGNTSAIQESIVIKHSRQYENLLEKNPMDYDEWINYLQMMQDERQPSDEVREIFERAISNKPPIAKKYYWRRYIYLWIMYAFYEELYCDNRQRAKEVYKVCLEIIPHKKFTFAKIWIKLAQIYIRDKDLGGARKVLGNAIGRCGKNKLYRYYIDMEKTLRQWDRVREIFKKYIGNCPTYEKAWIEFGQFEEQVQQVERTRAIYEMALNEELEKPMFVWREYIDFECRQENFHNCFKLYRRLLAIDDHPCIWVSFAQTSILNNEYEDLEQLIESSRSIFNEANDYFKTNRNHSSKRRQYVLEKWLQFEDDFGTEESKEFVQKKQPKKELIQKRVDDDDGTSNWIQVESLVFPDDLEMEQHVQTDSIFQNDLDLW